MNKFTLQSLQFYRLLFPVILVFVFGFLLIDHSPINTFTYHSWRQTQTYSVYKCFNDNIGYKYLECFFSQPIGADNNKYFGLEAPILQLLQSLLFPFQSPEEITNFFPFLSVFSVLAIIIFSVSHKFDRLNLIFLGLVLAVSFIRSPTVIFFEHSFQPNFLGLSVILLSFYLALMFDLGASFSTNIMIGFGCLIYPQFLLISLTLPCILNKFKLEKSLNSREAVIEYIKSALLILSPVFIYYSLAHIFVNLGASKVYPHSINFSPSYLIGNFTNGKFYLSFLDQISLVGIHLFVMMLIPFIYLIVFVEFDYFLMLPLFAYLSTFVLLFPLFLANTYYGVILILTLAVIFISSMHRISNLKIRYLINPRKSFLIFLLIVACLPYRLLPPRAQPWSTSYIFNQLIEKRMICNPQDAKMLLGSLDLKNKFLSLDCEQYDPTCRTATEYIGNNETHNSFFRSHLNLDNNLYLSCYPYSNFNSDINTWDFANKKSRHIFRKNNWILLEF